MVRTRETRGYRLGSDVDRKDDGKMAVRIQWEPEASDKTEASGSLNEMAKARPVLVIRRRGGDCDAAYAAGARGDSRPFTRIELGDPRLPEDTRTGKRPHICFALRGGWCKDGDCLYGLPQGCCRVPCLGRTLARPCVLPRSSEYSVFSLSSALTLASPARTCGSLWQLAFDGVGNGYRNGTPLDTEEEHLLFGEVIMTPGFDSKSWIGVEVSGQRLDLGAVCTPV